MIEDQRSTDTLFSPIAIVATALITIGVVMTASASMSLDRPLLEMHFWRTTVGRHMLLAAGALLAMHVAAVCTSQWLRCPRPVQTWTAAGLWLLTVVALLAVWFTPFGVERNGAHRWLSLNPSSDGLTFQPSELAKVALVIALACMLSASNQRTRSFLGGFVPACLCVGVLAGLVGVEDLGTGALLAAVGGMTLFAAGCHIRHILLAIGPAAAGLFFLVMSEEYRRKRVVDFLRVFTDPLTAGYHEIQSLTSIVSGGWLGRGLGTGLQKHGFLPEAESDFIFAIICEETGILGGMLIILLFILLAWLGLRVIQGAAAPISRLLAVSATAMIALQATINIAVVTVSAPTKGIPLPLISAGGSGLICLSLCVGILLGVAKQANGETVALPNMKRFVGQQRGTAPRFV